MRCVIIAVVGLRCATVVASAVARWLHSPDPVHPLGGHAHVGAERGAVVVGRYDLSVAVLRDGVAPNVHTVATVVQL